MRALRALPFRIMLAQLDAKIAREKLAGLRRQKHELERIHGRQPRKSWQHGDIIAAVRGKADPVAARSLATRHLEEKLAAGKRPKRKRK